MPDVAQRATVFGFTLNIDATWPGVRVCWLANPGVMKAAFGAVLIVVTVFPSVMSTPVGVRRTRPGERVAS